ncbi:hypothetical protein DFS34DRAFT_676513 [Phlyctochytrium arcticum]|nr:hypothetical protein DFS34DRAFT_676513 [Phlyctochytrium arcticum]
MVDEGFYCRRRAEKARREAREPALLLVLQVCLEQALEQAQQAREQKPHRWWQKLTNDKKMPSYHAYWPEDAKLDQPAYCEAQESEVVTECGDEKEGDEEEVREDSDNTFSFVRKAPEVLMVDEEFYRRRRAAMDRQEAREALEQTLERQAREERPLFRLKKLAKSAFKKRGKRSPIKGPVAFLKMLLGMKTKQTMSSQATLV